MSIQDLKNRLQKACKSAHIEILSESIISDVSTFLSGASYDLNRITTGSLYKGLPSKSVSCFVAPEGCFKSSLMALMVADAQKKGYTPVIIDDEGAWSNEFCTRWGVDRDNAIYIHTIFVEEVTTLLGELIDGKDNNLILVVDSLGGLESKKIIDDTTTGDRQAKADQGGLARKIKRMLKMFVHIVKAQDSIGMYSGHWYGKPDSYGSAEDIGGGKYVKLAADLIFSFKKSPVYLDPKAKASDRVVIGSSISACCLKNRYYPPFQEATIEINYKDGINKYAGLVDIALNCGIIQAGGAWFTLPNGNKVQGLGKVYQAIEEDPQPFIDALEEVISKTGYSSVNKEIAELEKELGEPTKFEEED